jgi:hypothetical protein
VLVSRLPDLIRCDITETKSFRFDRSAAVASQSNLGGPGRFPLHFSKHGRGALYLTLLQIIAFNFLLTEQKKRM